MLFDVNYIINCSSNKKYVNKKYSEKNDFDFQISKKIKDLNCKYIVVSYNNTYNSKSNSSRNKIELEEIKSILEEKGKTKIFKKNHKHFNAGNTSFDNHQEFIFITRVNHG